MIGLDLLHVPVLGCHDIRNIDLEAALELGTHRVQECIAQRTADFIQYVLGRSHDEMLTVVAGNGNNGRSAVACGRILAGRGFSKVSLILFRALEKLTGIDREQLALFESCGGKLMDVDDASYVTPHGMIIDGMLGFDISRPVADDVSKLIEQVNSWSLPVLSCGIPSGLNHVTGEANSPTIRATWTLSYHILQTGHVALSARKFVGELWSAEIDMTFTRSCAAYSERLRLMYKDSPFVRIHFNGSSTCIAAESDDEAGDCDSLSSLSQKMSGTKSSKESVLQDEAAVKVAPSHCDPNIEQVVRLTDFIQWKAAGVPSIGSLHASSPIYCRPCSFHFTWLRTPARRAPCKASFFCEFCHDSSHHERWRSKLRKCRQAKPSVPLVGPLKPGLLSPDPELVTSTYLRSQQ